LSGYGPPLNDCVKFTLPFLSLYYCDRHQPIEASEVQAYNDFIIFSVAGAGSLISGVIYSAYGKMVRSSQFMVVASDSFCILQLSYQAG
jgi:hypothetical protein